MGRKEGFNHELMGDRLCDACMAGSIGAVGDEKRGHDFIKILAGKDGAYICLLCFTVFVAVQGLSFAFFVWKSDACWMNHWAHGVFPWSWVIFVWIFT